jgi:hypothetical protein
MNTAQYLDLVMKVQGLKTDYAVAKALKIRPSTVYGYRDGRSHPDDEVSVRIAELVNMHPGLVMLDMHRERAKTPQERGLWKEIFEGFLLLFPHAKGARVA